MIIRVVIADDQPAVRDALRVTLDGESDIEVVTEAADGAEAVHQALWRRPDVVVMDLRMPYVDGISAIRQLADVEAPPRVLALTTFDTDEYLFGALRSGAAGFLRRAGGPAGGTSFPPALQCRGVRAG
ncbi:MULTISPECIES: response regulator [unclassified Nonomuraea]|uniref:response regulator n=1 Tax=unclassified Nonomuraea TaxID=2593643 RepID=UPI00191C51D8|nr:response regulator transcription factor [Nonomuraea sp. KC401]